MDNSPRFPGPTLAYCSMRDMRVAFPATTRPVAARMPLSQVAKEAAPLLEGIAAATRDPLRATLEALAAALVAADMGDLHIAAREMQAAQATYRDWRTDHAG
jgi:hypothetical protein